MKKAIGLLFLSTGLFLTACSPTSADISFDEEKELITIKGTDYVPIKEQVVADQLGRPKELFMAFPAVATESTRKKTIALTHLYETNENDLVVGINDSFYKIKEVTQVTPDERLNLQEVSEQPIVP